MEPVYISRYTLRSRAFLNSVAGRRHFEGVLIRVGDGFGCIHPWPELGDPSLEKCLQDLVGARRYPLVRRALRCAELDGVARQNEDWMFEEAEVPDSHATLVELTQGAVEKVLVAGFGTIKMKAGRDLESEVSFLNEMAKQYPQLRFRLDMNESVSPESIESFAKLLTMESRRALDFIEDPCEYSPKLWAELSQKTRLNFAVDREVSAHAEGAATVILKPALEEPWLLVEGAVARGQGIVITSYLDHPLGQSFAAWEAVRMNAVFPGAVGLCGLQTHGAFADNEFSEILGDVGPEFHPAEGNGLGFDELLNAQPWKLLDPF